MSGNSQISELTEDVRKALAAQLLPLASQAESIENDILDGFESNPSLAFLASYRRFAKSLLEQSEWGEQRLRMLEARKACLSLGTFNRPEPNSREQFPFVRRMDSLIASGELKPGEQLGELFEGFERCADNPGEVLEQLLDLNTPKFRPIRVVQDAYAGLMPDYPLQKTLSTTRRLVFAKLVAPHWYLGFTVDKGDLRLPHGNLWLVPLLCHDTNRDHIVDLAVAMKTSAVFSMSCIFPWSAFDSFPHHIAEGRAAELLLSIKLRNPFLAAFLNLVSAPLEKGFAMQQA